LLINTGAYSFRVSTDKKEIIPIIESLYGDSLNTSEVADFTIKVSSTSFLRRYLRPQVSFFCDQHTPFKPLPASQAYPLLEWGMNWCIATHDHTRLLIHAAVLVKNGQAIIFPALPGSGKSTLTAYHALSGWSLYSDEMAIINLSTGLVEPLYRPVCLKNDSIDLVKTWFPEAVFTPIWRDTQKGDVAHLKATTWAQHVSLSPAKISAVVFPKYVKDKQLTIFQLNQLQGFETLSKNAFNYSVLGHAGFVAIGKLIDQVKLFEIEYGSLQDVSEFLTEDVLA
jgi:HprK-related kinase A